MPLHFIQSDIVDVSADAIVSCGNSAMTDEGGVSGCIYRAAGSAVADECARIGGCAPGDAVATSAGELKARYIIHTVGPIWDGGRSGEEFVLRQCYKRVLAKAAELGCASVAMPLIASGRYGYPRELAKRVASEEISAFLEAHGDMEITMVLSGEAGHISRVRASNADLSMFIARNYVEPASTDETELYYDRDRPRFSRTPSGAGLYKTLDEMLAARSKPFRDMLRDLMTEAQVSDAELYNKAGVSRQTFNKIWNQAGYKPSKNTALSLAIGLELNYDQTLDLLGTLGYTLSHSVQFDMIVEYFIRRGCYDLFDINYSLDDYGEPPLGLV